MDTFCQSMIGGSTNLSKPSDGVTCSLKKVAFPAAPFKIVFL
jgi:hypothetical protein